MTATLIALALGTLLSEDVTVLSAGVLVRAQAVPLVPALLACGLGIWIGDLGLWAAGRFGGAAVMRSRLVPRAALPGAIASVQRWFGTRGFAIVMASRFVPGTRLPLYVAAGAARTSFRRFAAHTFVAVAAWTPLLLGAAAFADAAVIPGRTGWLASPAGRLLLIATVLAAWRLALALATARGRQRLAARLARIWRWEFWPMGLFYAPVAARIVWLALRHGGVRTISAANPGISDGGIVGESKSLILQRLPAEWTIPHVLLHPGETSDRMDALDSHIRRLGWSYPIVLKPDVGQRGVDVKIAHAPLDSRAYLDAATGPVLAQPYHPGPHEAGVFYVRRPGAARGDVLAITLKHFPVVVGDGASTLEDLVWAHPRYRMQARVFLSRLGHRATDVPAAGERVSLGIAGNHAQGALFTDGTPRLTPELSSRIDAIARAFPGFFIGRFDVRYGDEAAFLAGEDLAIVELNGATAECTNIYDPSRSLWSAYRQLFLQWRLVFEIGAANRRLGCEATSSSRLLRLVRAHLSTRSTFAVSD